MNKYGFENFSIRTIDVADSQEELDDIEELWISKLGTTDRRYGYNISFGGASPCSNPETRAKLSASLKGKPAWNRGKPMSPEHKENLRKSGVWDAGRGDRLTPKGRKSLSENRKGEKNPNFGGKANTPESIEKRASRLRGRPSWNLGIPQTEEAKEKMRGPKPWVKLPRPSIQGENHVGFRKDVSTEAIKQLRSIGLNFSKISRLLGCASQTVANRLKGWPESEFA